MDQLFHWLDIGVALALPVLLFVVYKRGENGRFYWRLFWIGVAIGLTWELAFHFLGPEYNTSPLYRNLTPWPLPPLSQPLLHALWDGGILLLGIWLITHLCASPHFTHFRWSELAVLLAWGIGSALLVEISASGSGWEYLPHWYNPPLLCFNETCITLLPILTWAIAPVVYYAAALRLAEQSRNIN